MIRKWWFTLAEKFSNVRLDGHIVMPNHFHGIIEITNRNLPVGADPSVGTVEADAPVGADPRVCPVPIYPTAVRRT